MGLMGDVSYLFHFGKNMKGLQEAFDKFRDDKGLEGGFDYHNFSDVDKMDDARVLVDGKNKSKVLKPIFKESKINGPFATAYFLITEQKYLDDFVVLKKIPAHRLIIKEGLNLSEDSKKALYLKNPQWVDFSELQTPEEISDYFLTYFSNPDLLRYAIYMDAYEFNDDMHSEISFKGNNMVRFKSHEGSENDYKLIFKTITTLGLNIHRIWELNFYFENHNPNTDIKVRAVNMDGNDVLPMKEGKPDQPLVLDRGQGGNLGVEVYAKGANIDFSFGQIDVFQTRGKHGYNGVGEHFSTAGMNYLFDPGDFKPPLNVYFSGWRPAGGVEGRGMLGRMEAPSLNIKDTRLVGGAFYLGDDLSKEIVELIQDCLKKLNFKSSDLILSGLSMGTYASFYYAAKLQPAWVIVGKPLVNLGLIANNGRLNRPRGGFSTALDIVQNYAGSIDEEGTKKADDIMWNEFTKSNYPHTNFAIAYMKDDDYDAAAFKQVSKYLRSHNPHIKILHKGLIGRHNDNTPGINNWFLWQYRNILNNDFGRNL